MARTDNPSSRPREHVMHTIAHPSQAQSAQLSLDEVSPPPPTELPPYSPSSSTPAYSFNPQADERRLAITTRSGARGHASRTSAFRLASKRAGVVVRLLNQEEGVTIPIFGRNALIKGTIELTNAENVSRIEIELEGHLKLTIAEGGKKSRKLFHAEHLIWEREGSSSQCPHTLNFIVPMPSSYSNTSGDLRPLPPSYQVIFPGVPGLFANSVYSLTVHVKRSRKLLWSHTDSLNTPIKYYPRTRAPRAIVKHSLPFFSLLKIAPEDYHQVESTMETRLGSGFAPIHCLLFIPSSCIYAITDEIPFHLQLVAPLTSLVALCVPHALSLSSGTTRSSAIAHLQSSLQQHSATAIPLSSPILLPNGTQGNSGASVLSASTLSASILQNLNSIGASLSDTARGLVGISHRTRYLRPTIRVFLLRQITVEVRGQKAWRTCVLGEGVLTPAPPGHDAPGRIHPYPYPRPSSSTSPVTPCSPRPSFISRRRDSTTSASTQAPPPDANADSDDADPLDALNWSGSVRVAAPGDAQVGGFAAGALGLVVKDFVVLSVVPPDPARSPLVEHQNAVPIRLVTDPLVEEEGV